MRLLGVIAVFACFGLGASALAGTIPETNSFLAEKIEGARIVTNRNAVIELYGVRLVENQVNPDLYQKAQGFLEEMLKKKPFQLDQTAFQKANADRNRYGEIHGQILLENGRWLQEELIARGYGLWSGAANYPLTLRSRLARAERAAAIERAGIWRSFSVVNANQPPKTYWDGQFIVAQGVVRDVYRSASVTYLNFGDDWRKDFTVAIPSSARKKFEREGWKLRDLKNKSITLRGLVRFYNGPYLELDFPEQLEIDEATGEG